MNREDATMAIGYLVGATTGWNDEAVLIYINEAETLNDVDALNSAIRNVVRTWSEARRPPMSVVLDAYRSELSRRVSERPALKSGVRKVTFEEGVEIARKAYEQECQRLSRKPDLAKFDRITERLK